MKNSKNNRAGYILIPVVLTQGGARGVRAGQEAGARQGDIRQKLTQNRRQFGAHFHAKPFDWEDKIKAAIENGCKRFDGAILGFGGCPFAKDELVGNIPTEHLIKFLNENNHISGNYQISEKLLNEASNAYQGF